MDLYLQIWLAIKNKLKSHLTPRKIKTKLFLLLHLFHCISNLTIFVGDKVVTVNDQKREKWEGYLIEIFLFEICPGVDTIQK